MAGLFDGTSPLSKLKPGKFGLAYP